MNRTQSILAAGTLTFLVLICFVLFGLIAGWLCDRFDRKLMTILSGIIGAIGVAVTVFGNSITSMYVAAAIIGMAYAFYNVSSWALTTDLVPKERVGEFLGLQNLAGAGAGAIGAYIGGTIADHSGYVLLMAMFGVMFLLSSVASLFIKENKS